MRHICHVQVRQTRHDSIWLGPIFRICHLSNGFLAQMDHVPCRSSRNLLSSDEGNRAKKRNPRSSSPNHHLPFQAVPHAPRWQLKPQKHRLPSAANPQHIVRPGSVRELPPPIRPSARPCCKFFFSALVRLCFNSSHRPHFVLYVGSNLVRRHPWVLGLDRGY